MTKKLKAIGTSFIFMGIYLSFQLIYLTVVSFIFGLKYSGLETEIFTENLNRMLSTNTLLAIIFSAFFSILLYYQLCNNRKKNFIECCTLERISLKDICISALGGFTFLFINGYIVGLIRYLGILTNYMDSFQEFSNSIYSANIALLIISVGVVGPIIEEIIFRGLIFNELKANMPTRTVVIVQAVLFGIFHMRAIQMIYATLLGLFLGVVFVKTKTILAPIILHITYNITSVMVSNYGSDTIFGQYFNYIVVLSCIIVVVILLYLFKNKSNSIKDELIL